MSTSTPFQPSFTANPNAQESPYLQQIIQSLNLTAHIEGGFFAETDRAADTIPSPFPSASSSTSSLAPKRPGFNPNVRSTSTSIHYLLTPNGPQGGFHRNRGRTVHTLHRGRGRYVIIHADEGEGEGLAEAAGKTDGEGAVKGSGSGSQQKRIESFIVGHDVAKGERLQWVVEGGKFKASYLLPDEADGQASEGLLISETVVPGFEYCDHDFLSPRGLRDLVGVEKARELDWLLSPLGKGVE